MEPYIPEKLPLTIIDWERHVPNIAQANSHLARFDGILQTIPNPELLLAPIMTQEAVISSLLVLENFFYKSSYAQRQY